MSGFDVHRNGNGSSGGPLVFYKPSSEESTPLLPGETRRKISQDGCKFIIYGLFASMVFVFVSGNLYVHFMNCPLYPSTMNAIRRGWEEEVARHDVMREEWRLEKQEHAIIEEEWRREVEDHDRIEEARRQREEEERQKLNMFWGGITAHTCTTYGTREYTARLMNLPATWEHRVEACKVTPLEVHGLSYLPKSCEDKGPGCVIGRWEINEHEPACATFWLWYKDKESPFQTYIFDGCISPGSGKRRIEHYLENLPKGSGWREFCATTPAHFHGMEFSGAHECFQHDGGTYGHWQIDDANCQ